MFAWRICMNSAKVFDEEIDAENEISKAFWMDGYACSGWLC